MDAGISQPTAKAWLSIMETTFIAFRLQPYFGNFGKRLVKTPKLHFYDTGLVCWLLGIRDASQLRLHPMRGAIFETWVVSEIAKHRHNRGEHAGLYFYRDQHGQEADLVIDNGEGLIVVEVKAGQTITSELAGAGGKVVRTLGEKAAPRRVVIFGGDRSQERTDADILGWESVGEREW